MVLFICPDPYQRIYMTLEAYALVILIGTMYGSTIVASRFCVGQFAPLTYTALRLTLAASIFALLTLLRMRGRAWPRGKRLWIFGSLFGIIGDAAPLACMAGALQFFSSGVAGILVTLFPLMAILFAHFMLPDEKLTKVKVAGITIAMGGAVLMALLGESGLPEVHAANPLGYFLVLIAATLAGGSSVFARKYLTGYTTWDLTSVRFYGAALFMLPFSLIFSGMDLSRVNWQGGAVLAYAAVILFFAFQLGFVVIKRYGVTANALVDYISPVAATLIGALLLDEKITVGMIASWGLLLGGVVLINLRQKDPLPAADTKKNLASD
jgi:drug/metabolite transporter (DMT)-like permease